MKNGEQQTNNFYLIRIIKRNVRISKRNIIVIETMNFVYLLPFPLQIVLNKCFRNEKEK